jgi:hypothetical protein
LFTSPRGERKSVAIPGIDATCIETRSGTMLAVLQRQGSESSLAIAVIPTLRQIATLRLPGEATAIAASPAAAYVTVGPGDSARAYVLRRDDLDFREQLIHNVHF